MAVRYSFLNPPLQGLTPPVGSSPTYADCHHHPCTTKTHTPVLLPTPSFLTWSSSQLMSYYLFKPMLNALRLNTTQHKRVDMSSLHHSMDRRHQRVLTASIYHTREPLPPSADLWVAFKSLVLIYSLHQRPLPILSSEAEHQVSVQITSYTNDRRESTMRGDRHTLIVREPARRTWMRDECLHKL